MLAIIWSQWPAQLEKIRWKIPQMLIIDQVFQSLNQFSNGFSAFDSYVWNDAKWQRNCSVLLIAFKVINPKYICTKIQFKLVRLLIL